MKNNFVLQVKSRLAYQTNSRSRFKVHSPFVFDLIEKVLKDDADYPQYAKIEGYKKSLSKSSVVIETVDFGEDAGNRDYISTFEKLGPLVKERSQRKKQGRLLFRLNRFFNPKTILEFGTAAGIGTAYLKSGAPESKLITMEGCASLADVASGTFETLNLQDIDIRIGHFEVNLPSVLEELKVLDMVFFDGNRRYEPIVKYFNICIEKAGENSYFVFNRIHRSRDMERAWNKIKSDSRVSISLDLYNFGIVFFRTGIPKQDFVIRY
ncbi:MAG: hypothetical protein JXR65_09860 [Bacteroidales bacterium]|nr:hypothetical protein [Bacteroidales bacterium]